MTIPMTRRRWLAATAGSLPLVACGHLMAADRMNVDELDRAASGPLLDLDRIGDPVIIKSMELLRHQDELFGFLLVPGLSADNNLVERSLRPLVIARKISGGSRSAEGSKTRMALFSLMQTWAANALDPFQQCLAALRRPTAHAPP